MLSAVKLALSSSRLRPLSTTISRSARMSTATEPQKHVFLIYAPDKTDPEALQRRLSVRERHLANAKKLHEQGIIKLGGAMVTEDSLTAAQKNMTGSMFLVSATNSGEVRKLVESDLYYTAGVWDPEKIVITPFVAPFVAMGLTV